MNNLSVQLSEQLQKAHTWYESIGQQKRRLVLGSVMGVVLLMWSSVIYSPLKNSINTYRSDAETNNKTIAEMQKKLSEGKIAFSKDPDEEEKKVMRAIQIQIDAIDSRMHGVTTGLVDPKLMTQVLGQILRNDGGLTLLKMSSLEPVSVEQLTGDIGSNLQTEKTALFRHGVVMKFEGTYHDVLNYLTAIEHLPWELFFGGLDYQVKTYPTAQVTLKIYTLSDHKALIGV